MTYTLITPKAKVIVFNVLACAELYQVSFGGSIVTNSILEDVTTIEVLQFNLDSSHEPVL